MQEADTVVAADVEEVDIPEDSRGTASQADLSAVAEDSRADFPGIADFPVAEDSQADLSPVAADSPMDL